MNTIIEMAREAGFSEWALQTPQDLERFAALVRADERERATRENAYVLDEREACAKVCDAYGQMGLGANFAANAIRARGNT